MPITRTSRIATLLLGLLALLATTGLAPQETRKSAPAVTYKIDAVHSTALFRVHHLGAGRFYGRFNEVTGTLRYAPGSASDLSFDVTIPIESVDTASDRLDGHLKSPDFFNAREFPTMTFKSKEARLISTDRYRVKGDLTIHGVTRPLTVEIECTGVTDMGRGPRCGFETSFTVKRSEFGMSYGIENKMLSDETMVIVSMEGTES